MARNMSAASPSSSAVRHTALRPRARLSLLSILICATIARAGGPTDPSNDPSLWGYQSGPWEGLRGAEASASSISSTVLHSVSDLPSRDGSFEVLLAGQRRWEDEERGAYSSCFLEVLDGETGLAGGFRTAVALSELPWVGKDPRGDEMNFSSRCTSAGPAIKGEGSGAFAYAGYGERGAQRGAGIGDGGANAEVVVPFVVYVPEDGRYDRDGAIDFDLPSILQENGIAGGAHYPVAFDALPLGAAGQEVPSHAETGSVMVMDVILALASSLSDRSSSSANSMLQPSDPAPSSSSSPSSSLVHPMRSYPYGSNFAVTVMRLQLFRSEGGSYETNVAWGPDVHQTDQAVAALANNRHDCPGCSAYAVDVKVVRRTTEGADTYNAIIGGSTDGTGAFFGYRPLSKGDDAPAPTSVNGFVVRLDATADGSYNACSGSFDPCYENPDATRIVSANSDDHEEVSGLCVIDDNESGAGGAVFVIGSTNGAIASESSGGMDIFIDKLRLSTLVSVWKHQLGSKFDDYGGTCALTKDTERVYIVGTVGGKISNKKKSRGKTDMILASFDALTSAATNRFPQIIGSTGDDVGHGIILGGGGVVASPRNGDAVVAGVTGSNLYAPKEYSSQVQTSAYALNIGHDSGNWLQPNEELFVPPADHQEAGFEGDQEPTETGSEGDQQAFNTTAVPDESDVGEESNGRKRFAKTEALVARTIICVLINQLL